MKQASEDARKRVEAMMREEAPNGNSPQQDQGADSEGYNNCENDKRVINELFSKVVHFFALVPRHLSL